VVRWGGGLAAVGIATVAFASVPAVALLGWAVTGAGLACAVPQVISASGALPGVNAGAALARVTTIGYLAFLVGPVTVGWLAERTGLAHALLFPAALGLVMVVAAPITSTRAADPVEATAG
jgi:hypothetical protein